MKSRSNWLKWTCLAVGSIAAGFAFAVLVDCGSFGSLTTPPSMPADVGDAIACAIADAVAQRPVDDCVQKYGQKLVDDALATLVDSQRFKMEKPEAHKFAMSLRTKPPSPLQPPTTTVTPPLPSTTAAPKP
jgi:hypothetical protein